MKYTASQMVERAKHLADVTNTDFLTHQEMTDYLNDTWWMLYQTIINKGDKQFVKETYLNAHGGVGSWSEYNLPDDFYQMCSLKDAISGGIVPRASESESITSRTYDIVNNRLRLYGTPTGNRLLLTYYATPQYITYPDKVYERSNYENILSVCKNTVLTTSGEIYTLPDGNKVGTIDLSDFTSAFLASPTVVCLMLENEGNLYLSWVDFDYNVLSQITVPLAVGALVSYSIDSNWNRSVVVGNTAYLYGQSFSVNGILQWEENYINIEDGYISLNGTATEIPATSVYMNKDFENYNSFYIKNSSGFYLAVITDEGIETEKINIKEMVALNSSEYGPITPTLIQSGIPDTLFNFPNELYFNLFAYNLAIKIAMKQNVQYEGLEAALNEAKVMWNNSLSQASDYTRIRNVY